MKTERNIFIAFVLNLIFAIIELIGGIVTGSVAILSDAMHDLGDAASIGLSFYFEKKSKKAPDERHTFGYLRYSVMGSVITTSVLLIGSALIILNSINKIFSPSPINYNGMIALAAAGTFINYAAAFVTHSHGSLNQKAVNLHMLEDVLGWIVVLTGALVMRFTDLYVIDPIMSIAISIFIITNAIKNLKEGIDILLEKAPDGINIREIKENLTKIDGIINAHHIHVWSMDGQENYAIIHIVTNRDNSIKNQIRKQLKEYGISHVTIEIEAQD